MAPYLHLPLPFCAGVLLYHMLPIAKYYLYIFMLYFYVQETAVIVEDDRYTEGEGDKSSSALTTVESRESSMT